MKLIIGCWRATARACRNCGRYQDTRDTPFFGMLYFLLLQGLHPIRCGCSLSIGLSPSQWFFFVMRFSPLPALWNILFVFGYFILYEYTVISRNYSILVLAFLLSIHFYARRQYLTWGIFIFILANTHLFGLVMGFWFVISSIQDAKDESLMKNKFYKAAVFIFLVGAVLSAIQIKPPGDSPFRPDIGTLLSTVTIEKLLAIQVRGFLPVPDFSNYNGWNSNYITAISKIFAGVISVVLAGLLLCIAAEKKNDRNF